MRFLTALNVAWFPPPPGVFKINVDIAIRPSFLVAAIVCRDSAGVIFHAETSILAALDPMVGEAYAVQLGVKVAGFLQLRDLIIESDSSPVIAFIQNPDSRPPWQFDNLLQNVRLAAGQFRSCRWQFVPHSANSLSHLIAQWTASSSFEGSIPLLCQRSDFFPWLYEDFIV